MAASITNETRNVSALAFIDSLNDNTYMFAGRVNAWDDEESPESIDSSESYTTSIKKSIVFAKKTSGAECTLGLAKHTWSSGSSYAAWDDEKDMIPVDAYINPNEIFYVYVEDRTSGLIRYNVYLCLDNNFDGVSTIQPTGESLAPVRYADGYVWKFMYNIDDSLLDYMNDAFVPCPFKDENKTPVHLSVENNAIPGTINRLVIQDQGSAYTTATITISGDGTGASVTPIITDGSITGYSITNSGSDYTYADITIEGDGENAVLRAVISPLQGHGFDAVKQLGANTVLFKETFFVDEGGLFPYISAYRRIGLIKNLRSHLGVLLTGNSYDFTDQIQVNNITGDFTFSSVIQGVVSGSTAILYNIVGDLFYLTDKKGDFISGEQVTLISDPSISASVVSINNNNIIDNSYGDVIYYENSLAVVRRTGQSETFIFSIEY